MTHTPSAGRFRRRLAAALGLDRHLGAVMHGAGWVMGIQAVGSAIAFGTQLLLARWMGAFEFGAFVYAWGWAVLLPVIGTLGLDKAVLRFVPEYLAREDWPRVKGVVRSARALSFLGSVALAVLCAAIVVALGERVPVHYRLPLHLGFAAVPFLALLLVDSSLARGFGWAALAYAPSLVVRPALFVLGVALLHLAHGTPESVSVTALALTATALTAIGVLAWLRRAMPSEAREAHARTETRTWLRVGLPLLVTESMFVLFWQADVVMLGILRGPEEVAIYHACMKTAGLALFVLTAVGSLATPRFAALHAAAADAGPDGPEARALDRFVRSVARWTFLPSLATVVGVVLVGRPLLTLFGPSFAAGYALLVVLVAAYAITATTGPAREYLIVGGEHDSIVAINAWAGVTNVVLNALLIPRFGMMGAGVASMVALVVVTGGYFGLVRRRLRLHAFFL